jgi:hypothetical protein
MCTRPSATVAFVLTVTSLRSKFTAPQRNPTFATAHPRRRRQPPQRPPAVILGGREKAAHLDRRPGGGLWLRLRGRCGVVGGVEPDETPTHGIAECLVCAHVHRPAQRSGLVGERRRHRVEIITTQISKTDVARVLDEMLGGAAVRGACRGLQALVRFQVR